MYQQKILGVPFSRRGGGGLKSFVCRNPISTIPIKGRGGCVMPIWKNVPKYGIFLFWRPPSKVQDSNNFILKQGSLEEKKVGLVIWQQKLHSSQECNFWLKIQIFVEKWIFILRNYENFSKKTFLLIFLLYWGYIPPKLGWKWGFVQRVNGRVQGEEDFHQNQWWHETL